MYLKKIRLLGFKSFCDPQILELRAPVSAIVGPNGCGKSNIIDAVKCLTGQSKAKEMRGGHISDLIFSGAQSRSAVGQAQVELVFDNREHLLKGPFAHYDEVAVKRVIARDGQSTFFINQMRCRRRDVVDLFTGTGLGPKSYAIIEQGMIARFIEAKPAEVRAYIEEVAGISRYKEHRKETLSQLESSQENLDRLHDMAHELSRQLRSLAEQAQQASVYQELKKKLLTSKIQHMAVLYAQSESQLEQAQKNVGQAQDDYGAKVQTARNASYGSFNKQQEYDTASDLVLTLQKEQHQIQLLVEQKKSQWQQAIQRRQYLEKDCQQWQAELDELQHECLKLQEDLQHQIQPITQLYEQEQAVAIELARAKEHRQSLAEQEQQSRRRLQKEQEQTHALAQQKSHKELLCQQQQREHQRLQQQHQELSRQIAQIEQELLDIDIPRLEQQALQARQNKEQQLAAYQSHQNAAALLDKDIEQTKWQLQQLGRTIVESEKNYRRTSATLQARLTQEVPWLSFTQAQEVGPQHCLEHQAHLLSLATAALYHGHQPPPLAQWDKIAEVDCEYVFGDSVLPSYWRHLRVCHSVEEAQQQYHHLQSHEALILPGGALLGPNWFRPQRQRSQALLVDLETAAAQAEQELQQQQQHYRVLNEQLQSLHHQKSVLSLREKELKNTMVAAQKNDEQHSHALVRAQQRCLDLQQRYHEKKQSAYQILQQKHAAEQSAQVLQSELAAISDNLLQLQQLLQEAQSEQRTIESQWHQAVTHCEQITAQYYTISSDIQRFKVQKEQKENHYQQYIKKQEEIKQLLADKKYQWEQSADPIAHLEEEMGADLLLQEQAQRRLHEQQEQLHVLEKEIEEEQKQQRALATQRDKAHAALIAAQMTLEKQQVHHTHLQEQILDNGWTLEQIREQQPPSSLETLKKEISMYQQQLEDLGPVNLRAIAEYEQQNARYQILQEQCTDLDQATAQIQQALDNLDKEMCTLFDETFHQLQKNFQRLFPLLFGGGKAQLILQQLDNPEAEEEAGVIIQAQPPGKKNASLSLLSGGEKALTAAALLFAFFELNPAPFCLLDEIDAPLDDSNTARLGQMIAKLSEKTQFIIVTHSKVMMEFASNLYGVTMKEPGVSRLVSVSLDEALETVGATL